MPNRLASETSPYLLQHADNPVEWYPWGPEALERAKEEDKPILLSVGYSACHWCHVMERESFEDDDVAALMNEAFVNVKVDREERPDVDAIYMRAVQALTGRGGWPLTAFLTPEGKPYYGGTYFPPEPRHGMPSFPQVLRAARDAWENKRDEVAKAAGEITELLERSGRPGGAARRAGDGDDGPPPELSPELMAHARSALASRYDGALGGFGSAPKFPQPPTLEFLLRHHHATGEEHALEMVLGTLRAMARGGIRDHLGGGFHRYSVDARWLVPHFEKMLYDNALLLRVYLHAWQLTGDGELRRVVEETAGWLLEDMQSPEGGFYSARDADSEGEEGLYYVWTPDEISDVLGAGEANLFNRVYGVTATGNFEGRNIPYLPRPLEEAAVDLGMETGELLERIEGWREALLEVRAEREPPLRDEKILAGWNGMTVRALAEAGGAMERDDWVRAADRALRWLLDTLRPEGPAGPLLHVHTAGRSAVPAFLEDVAALGNAALTLHEVTLDPRWLDEARRLAERCVDDFWVDDEDVFYDTAHDAEALVVRPREPMDNATPAGGSLAAELLLRTGHLFGEDRLTGIGRRVLEAEARSMAAYPSAFGRLLAVAQGMLDVPVELALVGEADEPATRALLRPFLAAYVPGRTVVGRAPGTPIPGDVPLLAGREPETGEDGRPLPTAWLCRSYTCLRPVTTPEGLREVLEETITPGEAGGLPGV